MLRNAARIWETRIAEPRCANGSGAARVGDERLKLRPLRAVG
jgi:hypothetical protein